jgi:hypothetical protein
MVCKFKTQTLHHMLLSSSADSVALWGWHTYVLASHVILQRLHQPGSGLAVAVLFLQEWRRQHGTSNVSSHVKGFQQQNKLLQHMMCPPCSKQTCAAGNMLNKLALHRVLTEHIYIDSNEITVPERVSDAPSALQRLGWLTSF